MRLWEKGGELDALVASFTVGDDPVLDLNFVWEDLVGSAAHVRVQEHAGLLSAEEARVLIGGLRQVKAQVEKGEFGIDPAHEDVHTEVEARLTGLVGAVAGKLHTGRSRNDQVLTDLRLWQRRQLAELDGEWVGLVEALLGFADQYRDVPLPGFTHLQPAMPSSYGQWAAGYAAALLDARVLLKAAWELADRCPLGSAAGYGSPLPLSRELAADLLGFGAVEAPETACQLTRGLVESAVLGALGAAVGLVGRWAWDISLFTTAGFALLRLPEAFTTGSSIMPQKRNPDVAELLRATVPGVRGARREIEDICMLPGGYHRDVQLTKGPLMRGVGAGRQALLVATHLAGGLQPTPVELEPALFAAAEAFRRNEVPFREAYRAVASEIKAGTFAPEPGAPPRVELSALWARCGRVLPEPGELVAQGERLLATPKA